MIDWAVTAQFTGGVTTTVVAVIATAAFLLRKRQRVRELRWLIRLEVKSLEINDRTNYFALPITADGLMALVRDPAYDEHFLATGSGFYRSVQEINQMAEEYYFWGTVLRLGRRPETL